MSISARVRELLGAAALVVVCTGVGSLMGYARESRQSSSAHATPSNQAEVLSVNLLDGTIGASTTLAGLQAGQRSAVVVALRARDIDSCEDLGRQLRELARSMAPGAALEVSVPEPDVDLVARFAHIERIPFTRISTSVRRLQMDDGSLLQTPAALVFDRTGRVLAGVSHPSVVPGARVQSFATELKEALVIQKAELADRAR